MANKLKRNERTSGVVATDSGKVIRTTVVDDKTADEVQRSIDSIDKRLAQIAERQTAPLQAQRDVLAAQLATLTA